MSAVRRLRRLGEAYRADARGNLTVVASAALMAVSLAVGSAIDYGRVVTARTHLAAALDAAALSAGSSPVTDTARLRAIAYNVLIQNFPERDYGPVVAFSFTQSNGQIDITARARMPMSFMSLAGIKTMDLPVSAQAIRSGSNVEVALVLDTTRSMSGNKLRSLKSAATAFVDTVVWDNQSRFYSKVALVPYSVGVNLGGYANAARGTLRSGTCSTPGCASYRFRNARNQNATFSASTCASERTGTEAYSDAPPSIAPVGINYASPNNPCLDSTLIPLTANKTSLKSAIDALDAKGSTAGQIGIAWGWYTLSRDFGLWSGSNAPAAYGTEKVSKIAVIMTDGEFNTAHCNGVVARNSGSGSGVNDDKINCDANNGNAIEQAEALCGEMKKKKIVIYTIGFDIADDTAAQDVLRNCASGTSYAYLAATDAELQAAFREIGRKLSALRLSR